MLDKPFSTGGWPNGKDRGWLPDSKPVNKQIKDYLDDMGLLEESILSSTMLAGLFAGCSGGDYNISSLPKKNKAGMDRPDCITDVYYEPRWDHPSWKHENDQTGISGALGKVNFDTFKAQFETSKDEIRVKETTRNDVPVLQVDWAYVPQSCPYFGSAGPTKGTSDNLLFSDQLVDDIFAADEVDSSNYEDRENFLIRLTLYFPIYEIDNEKFVAEPVGHATMPVQNSTKCAKEYAKWFYN